MLSLKQQSSIGNNVLKSIKEYSLRIGDSHDCVSQAASIPVNLKVKSWPWTLSFFSLTACMFFSVFSPMPSIIVLSLELRFFLGNNKLAANGVVKATLLWDGNKSIFVSVNQHFTHLWVQRKKVLASFTTCEDSLTEKDKFLNPMLEIALNICCFVKTTSLNVCRSLRSKVDWLHNKYPHN